MDELTDWKYSGHSTSWDFVLPFAEARGFLIGVLGPDKELVLTTGSLSPERSALRFICSL